MDNKVFSLAVSPNKLKQLKEKKTTMITHCETRRWKDFCRIPRTRVRFFDTVFYDDAIFAVCKVERITRLGEPIVKITIKL